MSDLNIFKDGYVDKTICYLVRTNGEGNKEVLLSIHRKQGKRNGVGGKVGDKEEWKNETVEEGAIREVKEELGIDVVEMTKRGVIDFIFKFGEKIDHTQAHVFFITKWNGVPKGLEVDDPQWYEVDSVPWGDLWAADKVWLSRVLQGDGVFKAEYVFDKSDGDDVGKETYFTWED